MMMEDIKKSIAKIYEISKKKNIRIIFAIVLLAIILFSSSFIRVQNINLLKDSTTGKYIPLALDPFYFLRLAETIIEEGSLPEYDSMRYPSLRVGFSNEILPIILVGLYKMIRPFNNEITIGLVDIISPVIFFVLGLIVFFFLIYSLTKSKTNALISTGFLSIIPLYLYRTLTGFADHESIGMFAFFLTLLIFSLTLQFLEKSSKKQENLNPKKQNKKQIFKNITYGLILGIASAFTIASWGGIAKFVFIIIPLSFFIIWIMKSKNFKENQNLQEDTNSKKTFSNYLWAYLSWSLFCILFAIFFGYNFSSIINIIFLNTTSILNPFVFLFLLVDFTFMFRINKILDKLKNKKIKKSGILLSLIITLILSLIILGIFKGNSLSFLSEIINKLSHPFGIERTGLTVAENAQPYLMDWVNQITKGFFWLFYIGLACIGINFSKNIDNKKNKILFCLSWIILISGILFSRISAGSILNGENFLSKLVYFGSIILFIIFLIYAFLKAKIKLNENLILIISWTLVILIAARGAVRLFFVIMPLVCFIIGYAAISFKNYYKKSKKSKDELVKMILGLALIFLIILLMITANIFITSTTYQAKNTGLSANSQWQNAMAWVRNNTNIKDIFIHWWDYGYWVQYLGERPTVTDGGHANGYWDHLIGRYLLTTPKPETALSLMKSHNVSYLLIDPTDIGKYPAYSSIGNGKDNQDRYSWIITMISDPKLTQETQNETIRVYQGGSLVDQDIIYSINNTEIFLPEKKSAIIGIILKTDLNENSMKIKQPEGVFLYNEEQIRIPLRYVYYNNQILDFKQGLDSIVYIFPKISQTSDGLQIDPQGALIYLSQKNMWSLVSQMYILNNSFEKYQGLKLVHSEQDPYVNLFKNSGTDLGDFIYFNGIKAPIKIWKFDCPLNILEREEFLSKSGDWAEFDNLQFIK